MQPLSLTLKGFRGIRDGLGLDEITLDLERLADGAQLVAIVGSNGRGKTTIMDSLQPFATLPSRAAAAGPGGFSFYDHVYLPENVKDLTWAHEGRSYRSQLVIRLNGRRRTEAYLHMLDDHGCWSPVQLDDGTVSDGKVETYTRCIESICGSADTFFTSVFSAQGKRQLSTYRNAEIKTLLADLLGQEEIRALGQKAAETARLLKTALTAVRQEQAGLGDEGQRLAGERRLLDGAAAKVTAAQGAKQVAQSALDAAQVRQVQLATERDQSRAVEARRAQLAVERRAVEDADTQATRALQAQDQTERQRLERLDQRVGSRLQSERSRRQALLQARQRCRTTLSEADSVERAVRRLPLVQRLLESRVERARAGRERVQVLTQCRGIERLAEQKVAGIERDAGRAAMRAEELRRRFGLAAEVPCAGTDLQGRCKLLGDAREAQALVPSATAQIAQLARDKAQAVRELQAACCRRETLVTAPRDLAWAEHCETRTRERANRMTGLAAKAPACVQARATLDGVDQELAAMGPDVLDRRVETVEERTERAQIAASRQVVAEQLARQADQTRATMKRLGEAVAALPARYDEAPLTVATTTLSSARDVVASAERALLVAVRNAQAFDDNSKRQEALGTRMRQVVARRSRVEAELSNWNLFARCLSNDGLIALAIDDAGPALSGLANDLLLACHGSRFTVSIHTLLETGKGEQKEGFDIVVHDGETGDSKSVGLMSGGERVAINETLVRAVALYLAQHTGRRYTTLFSDEIDGALDPDRKRLFMAMKREVLRLGGYEREFFISQSPELTAMADAVIDLDAMAHDACPGSAGATRPAQESAQG
ncbi:DNA repair protein [Methylibium sp.]|uniref:DNA repair protein n=1 Tax=Methylibium sp. TaxID=2067992 RepID=UPI003D113CED